VELKNQRVEQEALEMLKFSKHIFKASLVKHAVMARHTLKVTDTFVRKVFRHKMLLKYKRVKLIPYLANTGKSLVLRQQFAMVMLDLLQQGKRILNIDETWLNTTSFHRRKWRQHGTTNSVRTDIVTPRVSLILGFDSVGESYVALTQVNTDSRVMQLYLFHLAQTLDIRRKDWRKDTVILLDGARYHTC
jgi:hypothetical protein